MKIPTSSDHKRKFHGRMRNEQRKKKEVLLSLKHPPTLRLPEATRGKAHQVPSGSGGSPWCPSTGQQPGIDGVVSSLPANSVHLVLFPQRQLVSVKWASDASSVPSVRIHDAVWVAENMCYCWPLGRAYLIQVIQLILKYRVAEKAYSWYFTSEIWEFFAGLLSGLVKAICTRN